MEVNDEILLSFLTRQLRAFLSEKLCRITDTVKEHVLVGLETGPIRFFSRTIRVPVRVYVTRKIKSVTLWARSSHYAAPS